MRGATIIFPVSAYGPGPYCQVMEALKIAGIKVLSMSE